MTNKFLQQTISLFTLAFVAMAIGGWLGFKSTLLGGSAWLIPNLYFLWKMPQIKSIFDNAKMLKHFFYSEALKLLLSFGMIILILLTCSLDRRIFLGGYAAMILVSFLTFFKCGEKNKK